MLLFSVAVRLQTFVSVQGDIEKTDELLLSDEPDEPEASKRKVKPKAGKGISPSKGGVKSMLLICHVS